MYDSVIFDLDGTLWDSTKEVAIAFSEVVRTRYPEVTDEITPEKLSGLFGMLLDDIAVKLFTSVDKEKAIQIMKECCEYECEYLIKHNAKVYDGLEETLKELYKDFKLIIVSNCQDGYIQCFFKANPHLEKYFVDFECPGRTGKAKAENIKLVIERNNLKNPVYVGDTAGDGAAAKKAGIPFIYARYGLGQADEYDDVIDSPLELVKKLKQ